MNGLETLLLRNRLAAAGFAPSVFRYPTLQARLPKVTAALAVELRSRGEHVHVVGHSLGGLLILETFETQEALPPGRIVLLGCPAQGSRAARVFASWPFGQRLLGPLAAGELTREQPRAWRGSRDLGIIAGSLSAGMGRWLAELPVPNDGTVSVDETRLPGASEHVVHDVSHTGILLSAAVADSLLRFLRTGSFAKN